MALLHEYYVPGMNVKDYSSTVPLDWSMNVPGQSVQGETLQIFYRVLCAPEHVHDDLPLLVFLQGGPGGMGPRPLNPSSDGWIAQALQHFRIVLPDQRGTGRSSCVQASNIGDRGDAKNQASYLKKFLADSIIRDFEHIRLTDFHGKRWVSLGQSYGGFLTLTYLSLFPQALIASFVTGGIAHVPADAQEVYEHTFPRMKAKSLEFYHRYPQDVKRIAKLVQLVRDGHVVLPNGEVMSVERIQTLGSGFGMKPGFERVHWMLDTVFAGGDGEVSNVTDVSDEGKASMMNMTTTSALYWPLQELIYANGELDKPIDWAANRVYNSMPEFSVDCEPLLFTGEAIFPWMFEQEKALQPFAGAMDVLMNDTHFGVIYDEAQLLRNEVPLQATVYVDDMYVDSTLQLDTLSRVGNSHYWATNEFEHDGVHGSKVFNHMFQEALQRGDLEELFTK
ncbi:MAG: alpha/beta fold hydrolase [Bifidobacteriaceae bacterium]|nr:alpha/beta fold hydrolase [Bifidobacteriaceae bacterium]